MDTLARNYNLLSQNFSHLQTRFDPEYGVLWSYMNSRPVPCFTVPLLRESRQLQCSIEGSGGEINYQGIPHLLNYVVLASARPNVFNLGGDLALFLELIKKRDRARLEAYAKLCVDVCHHNIVNYNLDLTTISLVQGDALGGGMESALSSSVVIAERNVKMALPEVLMGLFPGMGAYSLLARRVGMQQAEKIILSGRSYTAEQMYEIGLIDILAEPGEGESAVYSYIRKQHRTAPTRKALQKVRQCYNPISYKELLDITCIWVDAALQLKAQDIKVMERLIRAQAKNYGISELEERYDTRMVS